MDDYRRGTRCSKLLEILAVGNECQVAFSGFINALDVADDD